VTLGRVLRKDHERLGLESLYLKSSFSRWDAVRSYAEHADETSGFMKIMNVSLAKCISASEGGLCSIDLVT
jgi:hypothetical protein